jgi:hypothetical protein
MRALVLLIAVLSSALLLGLVPSPASASTGSFEEEGHVSELEQQAGEIEAELKQAPRDEALLAKLVRTRIDAANTIVTYGAGDSKQGFAEIKGQLNDAYAAWSRYLKVAKKPKPGLAELVAPALFQRAELAKGAREALKYVKPAAAAETIVAQHRPSENSWSILSFYELFAQRYNAADKDLEKALAFAKTPYDRKSLEKKFKEVEKNARKFGKELKPGK